MNVSSVTIKKPVKVIKYRLIMSIIFWVDRRGKAGSQR
ncbi:hypothetical protein C7534_12389 [Pseudomonas sp. OV226]|nr:hypothetical protein C7534_12389 [Pseudomonas sp. OV226]